VTIGPKECGGLAQWKIDVESNFQGVPHPPLPDPQ